MRNTLARFVFAVLAAVAMIGNPTSGQTASSPSGCSSVVNGKPVLICVPPGFFGSDGTERSSDVQDGACAINIRPPTGVYQQNVPAWQQAVRELFRSCARPHVSGISTAFLGTPYIAQVGELLSAIKGDTLVAMDNPCDSDASITAALNSLNDPTKVAGLVPPNEINVLGTDASFARCGYANWQAWLNPATGRLRSVDAAFRAWKAAHMPQASHAFMSSVTFNYVGRAYVAPNQTNPPNDGDGIGVGSAMTGLFDVVNIHGYGISAGPLGPTGNAHERCGRVGAFDPTITAAAGIPRSSNFCFSNFMDPAVSVPRIYGERFFNSANPWGVVAAYLPLDEMIQRKAGFSRYYVFQLLDCAGGFETSGIMTGAKDCLPKTQTVAAVDGSPAAQTVPVEASRSIVVGEPVVIDAGQPDQETVTVLAVPSGRSVRAVFAQGHRPGATLNTAGLNNVYTATYSPKPGFFALQGYLEELADPGAPATPVNLEPAFSGTKPVTTQWYVTQKSSGQYVVLIGDVAQQFTPATGAATPTVPYSVTMSIPFKPAAASIESQDVNASDPIGPRCTVPAVNALYGCPLPPKPLTFAQAGNRYETHFVVGPYMSYVKLTPPAGAGR